MKKRTPPPTQVVQPILGESIYRKKGPNPQQIATKGFSTVFGSFRGQEQHTKNPQKSHNGKVVIFKMASKMAAMICYWL